MGRITRKYAVLGATGNTGSVVAERLISEGQYVRVIGRESERLREWEKRGAEVSIADYSDISSLAGALKGMDAVYTLIPPSMTEPDFGKYQDRVGESITQALKESKIPYVVFLSSIGAHLKDGTGPIKGLHRQEERLNNLDANVLHLRAGYFIENLFSDLPVIKQMGVNGSIMNPDIKFAMVSTRDIGNKAAELLLSLDFSGKVVFELVGPEEISLSEATEIIGRAIGMDRLPYVEFPENDLKEGMIGMGLSKSTIDTYIEMMKAFNSGAIKPTQTMSVEHRGSTRLSDYETRFKSAWSSMS